MRTSLPAIVHCARPQESTNEFLAANGSKIERTGLYTIRRVDGMYDPLNGESWNIPSTNTSISRYRFLNIEKRVS